MEHRQMPPVVNGEKVVLGPVRLPLTHPSDSGTRVALHFVHMRHGVVGPRIIGAGIQRRAAGFFGATVIAALLAPKGEHAKKGGVAVI